MNLSGVQESVILVHLRKLYLYVLTEQVIAPLMELTYVMLVKMKKETQIENTLMEIVY